MNKKLVLLLPAFFLALSLGACNGKKTPTPTPEPTPEPSTPAVNPTPSTPAVNPTPSTPAVTPTPSTPATPTPSTPATPDVPATGYAAVIGSQVITLTEDPEAQNVEAFANRKQGYKNLVSNVKAGDKIEFYKDGEAYSYVDASGDNTGAQPPVYNNYVKTSAGFAIQADSAVENNFYVNLWNANEKGEEWITFFLEGGTSGNHEGGAVTPTPSEIDYSSVEAVTDKVVVAFDASSIMGWDPAPTDFAIHAWNGETAVTPAWDSGSQPMTLVSGHLYSVALDVPTGMILRFKQGSDTKQTVDISGEFAVGKVYGITVQPDQWEQNSSGVWCMKATATLVK